MSSKKLENKKVLFFGPKTFGYENLIKKELENLGAEVLFHSDKSSENVIYKVLLRLYPRVAYWFSDRYFRKWFDRLENIDFDIVFIIKGEGISSNTLKLLKRKLSTSGFIFHIWDSIYNVKLTIGKLKYFDHTSSFDVTDCKKIKGLKYRPLFFQSKYSDIASTKSKGVFFVGTLNGDRASVIAKLEKQIVSFTEFKYIIFARTRLEYYLRYLAEPGLRKINKNCITWKPISHDQIKNHFAKSEVILDIEHPNQTGLTMRTFEALASGKKIITTNRNIESSSLYHPHRICIIDRKKPVVTRNFLESDFKPMSKTFYSYHSLRGWICDIFKEYLNE